eukprot:TRINITY_DN18387_c0_g1_i1.p1 TRINITY_DN18387_c0_g1~~TRINITY_DN18387_c0_g1_i1.p1  ORF type:complete len:1789 (-),score=368.82 TRINITY_DN18387_c0_g1_i1:574-5940(-)
MATAADAGGAAHVPLSIVVPEAEEIVPNLCRALLSRLERAWLELSPQKRQARPFSPKPAPDEESVQDLLKAEYRPRSQLRRRFPDEIEIVLQQVDQKAMIMIEQTFSSNLELVPFSETIVQTGTYDAERVVAFVGGLVDLYLELLRSQSERANRSASSMAVNWAQLMNHFIESPEIAMFEGSEVGAAMGAKNVSSPDKMPQVQRSTFVDCGKHYGSMIHKIYWMPSLELLTTAEGTESVYFWSPTVSWDVPRIITPNLPPDFFDERGKALWTVLAVAWDNDAQDLVALLSNRLLISWRLRNREKGQFQQKRELRFNATRAEGRSMGESKEFWKVYLNTIDPKTGENVESKARNKDPTEAQARRAKREERLAAEASQQLDVWWNSSMKCWVTGDAKGQLFFWDLREQGLETVVKPTKVLTAHTRIVTSHLELSKFKFTTCSLDRSIMLWDIRNMGGPEVKIEDVTGSILSQAYLPSFASLVTVGCEKRVYVWSIDSTAYRGVRAKLSGHQANLLQVSAGQRVFFTLDEAQIAILWDGATLAPLQTCSCVGLAPRHTVVMPSLGRICLAGRRLNFFDGNEQGSIALGAAPTKEQLAKAKRQAAEGASRVESAVPRWCGLGPSRGVMVSATEVEVRLHSRTCPGQSRAIFNTPEGDSISAFGACDALSFAVLGTAKGAIHFLKYRSGFPVRVYRGKSDDIEEWQAGGGATAPGGAGAPTDASGTEASSAASPVAGNTQAERISSPAGGNRAGASNSKGVGAASGTSNAADFDGGLGGLGVGAGDEGVQQSVPATIAQRDASRVPPKDANSPSMEDIQRGLSSNVTCLMIVEEQRRVYVGTGEGRVIIFSTEGDCPVLRWVSDPDDTSPVTCLHVAPWAEGVEVPDGEEPGLMAVGTQEGSFHIYSLANLRLAGSVNIPRALLEGGQNEANNRWVALRHIRFAPIAAEYGLPITLLTVDNQSRIRIWGLRVHVQSGKLRAMKLILDAGQIQENQCVPPGFAKQIAAHREEEEKARKKAVEEAMQKAKVKALAEGRNEQEAAEAAKAEQKLVLQQQETLGMDLEGENKAAELRCTSKESVRLTALATMPSGPLMLPLDALDRQPWEGPAGASAQIVQEMETSPYFVSKMEKATAQSKDPDSSLFQLTQPQSTMGASTGMLSKMQLGKEEIQEAPEEFSGSESDGDAETSTVPRFAKMPKLPVTAPAHLWEGDTAAAAHLRIAKAAARVENDIQPVGDGNTIVWLADSAGWIWCIDLAATIAEAVARSPPIAVALDAAMVAKAAAMAKAQGEKSSTRKTLRISASAASLEQMTRASMAPQLAAIASATSVGAAANAFGNGVVFEVGMLMGAVPRPRPENIRVVGAWPAHTTGIASLVVADAHPAALVSVDTAKEVKVWSSTADIWAHFSLRSVDGQEPATAIWPPPQVLAAQMTIMKMAKGLCRRLGFEVSKSEEREKSVAGRRKAASKHLSRGGGPGSPAQQAAARRAAKQRRAAERALAATEDLQRTLDPRVDSDTMLDTMGTDSAVKGDDSGVPADAPPEPAVTETVPEAVPKNKAEAETPDADDEGGASAVRPDSPAADSQADLLATDVGALGSSTEGRRKRTFTSQQMREMLRNHAFSSGYQSYKRFASRPLPSTPAKGQRENGTDQLDARRESFFGRAPAAFGVELYTETEKEAWDAGVRTMGHRSTSEGALLRYAQNSVEEIKKSVKNSLGVDVTVTTRSMMKKPSFVSRLDVGKVSSDPANPSSATGQAVRKLVGSHSAQSVSLPLLSAGQSAVVGKGKAGSSRKS